MGFILSKEAIKSCRIDLEKAKPYRPDEKRELYFDYLSDREEATTAMEMLKDAGLWTEEDEKKFMT